MLYDDIHMKYSQQVNPQKQKIDRWLLGPGSRGQWQALLTRYDEVFFWGDKNVLEFDKLYNTVNVLNITFQR